MTVNGNSENEQMLFMDEMQQEIQKKLKLAREKERRETFKKWVFSDNKKCNASKLAEAGFYFVGSKNEPDAVQCVFCDKALDGWDEDDDPWQEHQQHSSQCEFIKLNKPESKLTLYQLMDLQYGLLKSWIKKIFETRKGSIVAEQQNFKKQLQDLKKRNLY